MKLHRLLLLLFLSFLSMFSASAQDLLPHKATYNYVREVIHVSPDVSAPYVFFEEHLLLDSQVIDTAYYTVMRRTVSDHDNWFGNKDDVTYYLAIHDSVIYFTGDILFKHDSMFHFEKELIFDLKLKKGDSLQIRNSKNKTQGIYIKNNSLNTITKTRQYNIKWNNWNYSGDIFDSRFGFLRSGLLPYQIVYSFYEDDVNLLSVCTDSILYISDSIYSDPIKDFATNTNFCDSLVYDAFIDAFIASGIEDNPSTLQFSAFPNPFTNQLQIDTKEQMRYSIRNLQGQEILSGQTNKTINTAQLAKGIYLLHLESEDGLVVKKIIKR